MIIVKIVYVRRNLWRCDIYVIYMYISRLFVSSYKGGDPMILRRCRVSERLFECRITGIP